MKSVKKMYVSEIEGPKRRGRPVVRWKARIKENMHDRGEGIELARRECAERYYISILARMDRQRSTGRVTSLLRDHSPVHYCGCVDQASAHKTKTQNKRR